VRLGIDLLDRHGNRYLLRGHYRGVDRSAPPQWKTYLGDYGTLRGHPHQELAGDQGAWASLDIRWGFDLWRALKVPGLRNLGLQTVTFLDWGRTWAYEKAAEAEALGAQGWRMDAGVGFGKLLGVPGTRANLRIYLAHPVFDGQRDQGWRVLLAFEK
jgi:hemolysin activation/secretion protein